MIPATRFRLVLVGIVIIAAVAAERTGRRKIPSA